MQCTTDSSKFAMKLSLVCSQVGVAGRAVMVRVLAAVNAVRDETAGPEAGMGRRLQCGAKDVLAVL